METNLPIFFFDGEPFSADECEFLVRLDVRQNDVFQVPRREFALATVVMPHSHVIQWSEWPGIKQCFI